MNFNSKFIFYSTIMLNRIMALSTFKFYNRENGETEEDNAIERKDLIKYAPTIYEFCEEYDCCNCNMRGDRVFDNWCSCCILVYLNRSILGLWGYNDDHN